MSESRKSDNLSDLSKPGKPRKASIPANPAGLDVKGLDELAKNLEQQEIEHERKLRRELEAVNGRLSMDRCEMGRILASYRIIYKAKRRWHAFCKAVGLNKRSALRIIGDYTAAKALPEAIREAANRRGIDIAAMKKRPLLEKLIELGFEDGANADDLIQRGFDELHTKKLEAKKKREKSARSLSPDQRFRKAYDSFVNLYPDVNSASFLTELNKLHKALKSLYKGPSENKLRPTDYRGMRLPESSINLFEGLIEPNLEKPQPKGASLSSPQV